jgi:non-lysosomal glucosylceramidase
VYSDEVWTGIEYQVAAHLIYEGHIDEGLTVVKALRDRHDGYRRNPWNEVECGHHYARSLASWALLPALSGFKFDMLKGEVGFAPMINENDFRCFWSTGKAWGTYSQTRDADGKPARNLEVLYGDKAAVKLAQ